MSASTPLLPTRIEKHSETEMAIEWTSGERFALPFAELRFQCPCAVCVDEKTGVRVIRREQIPADIRPLGVQLVGRYAVQVRWSDNHATGMMHFDRLYELCREAGKLIRAYA